MSGKRVLLTWNWGAAASAGGGRTFPQFLDPNKLETTPGSGKLLSFRCDQLAYHVPITTGEVDRLEAATGSVSSLLEQGLSLTVGRLSYVSTELNDARLKALKAATANASERAKTIVEGVGGDLGGVRSAGLGVYQIVPRNSNEISDYGINDTSTKEKDVIAVVSVTFGVD
jgi:hypothetical protein